MTRAPSSRTLRPCSSRNQRFPVAPLNTFHASAFPLRTIGPRATLLSPGSRDGFGTAGRTLWMPKRPPTCSNPRRLRLSYRAYQGFVGRAAFTGKRREKLKTAPAGGIAWRPRATGRSYSRGRAATAVRESGTKRAWIARHGRPRYHIRSNYRIFRRSPPRRWQHPKPVAAAGAQFSSGPVVPYPDPRCASRSSPRPRSPLARSRANPLRLRRRGSPPRHRYNVTIAALCHANGIRERAPIQP